MAAWQLGCGAGRVPLEEFEHARVGVYPMGDRFLRTDAMGKRAVCEVGRPCGFTVGFVAECKIAVKTRLAAESRRKPRSAGNGVASCFFITARVVAHHDAAAAANTS